MRIQDGALLRPAPCAGTTPLSPTLEGRSVVVLGQSPRLACAIAEACAGAGAWVLLQTSGADRWVAHRCEYLQLAGMPVHLSRAGASPHQDLEAVFEEATDWYQRPDVLVTTVATLTPPVSPTLAEQGQLGGPLAAGWEQMIDTALLEPLAAVRQAGAWFMRGRNPQRESRAVGRIVCVAPPAHPNGAQNQQAMLCQQATRMLVEGLARQLAPYQVRVNGIVPGVLKGHGDAQLSPDSLATLIESIPDGRLGDARDVGRAAAWLASDAADYLTGVVMRVDGGLGMAAPSD
jgi:glucose 1-dehydrogenase